MPSQFVPFLKSGPPVAGAPVATTTDNAEASAAFVALGNSASAATVRSPCTHASAGPAAQPTVTLQKDGDRVTHIRVQCTCGQVVELECAY